MLECPSNTSIPLPPVFATKVDGRGGECAIIAVFGSNRIGFFRFSRSVHRKRVKTGVACVGSQNWVVGRADRKYARATLLTHHRRHLGGDAKAHGAPFAVTLGPGPICYTGTIPSSRKQSRKLGCAVQYALSSILFFCSSIRRPRCSFCVSSGSEGPSKTCKSRLVNFMPDSQYISRAQRKRSLASLHCPRQQQRGAAIISVRSAVTKREIRPQPRTST